MRRLVWRHIPASDEPLHFGWIQRARGRWNTRRPRLACLYTALSRDGAIAEYRKHFLWSGLGAGGEIKPRDLVSLIVDVEPVLDLTDSAVLRRLFIADTTTLTGDTAAHRALCRRIAWDAVRDGYRAIHAPSAALEGARTLMIYPESQFGRILLRNGPDRIPLNYGPNPLVP
jgi:RES domain-containing protein